MKAYIALFRQQFLSRLQYRAAFWSQVITSIFWAYVHTAIIAMFYRFGIIDVPEKVKAKMGR